MEIQGMINKMTEPLCCVIGGSTMFRQMRYILL